MSGWVLVLIKRPYHNPQVRIPLWSLSHLAMDPGTAIIDHTHRVGVLRAFSASSSSFRSLAAWLTRCSASFWSFAYIQPSSKSYEDQDAHSLERPHRGKDRVQRRLREVGDLSRILVSNHLLDIGKTSRTSAHLLLSLLAQGTELLLLPCPLFDLGGHGRYFRPVLCPPLPLHGFPIGGRRCFRGR
jgi:hypothetical protein